MSNRTIIAILALGAVLVGAVTVLQVYRHANKRPSDEVLLWRIADSAIELNHRGYLDITLGENGTVEWTNRDGWSGGMFTKVTIGTLKP